MNRRSLSHAFVLSSLVVGGIVLAPPETRAATCTSSPCTQWRKIEAAVPKDDARFGTGVAIEGATLIVGAFIEDVGGVENAGRVYPFDFQGGTFVQQSILGAISPMAFERVGYPVKLSGDRFVAGASAENQAGVNPGKVYLFERVGGTWQTTPTILTPDDGADEDLFGEGLSIEGDTIVVGAPEHDAYATDGGAVYVFEKVGGAWQQMPKLGPSDPVAAAGFGSDVHLKGPFLFVGAPGRVLNNFPDQGAVYVFEKIAGVWTQTDKILAPDGLDGDAFGNSMQMDGPTLVVGAPLCDDDGLTNSGAAYVFDRVGSAWVFDAKLRASNAGAGNDHFGWSVAIQGDLLVSGAYGKDDVATNAGAAYVFERIGGTWTETIKLIASDGAEDDGLGADVDIDGDVVVLSSEDDDAEDPVVINSGSVYLYSLRDTDGDDVPDSLDACPTDPDPCGPCGTLIRDGVNETGGSPTGIALLAIPMAILIGRSMRRRRGR